MNLLTPLQLKLLKTIGQSELSQKYIWTGGTALAYRLNHRRSTDLDFFSTELEAPEIFLSKVKEVQKKLGLKQVSYQEKLNRRLFVLANGQEKIKLEFVYFPFSPLVKPKEDAALKVKIDSLKDIAVNKVLTAYQRQEPKDVYDLCLLCQQQKFNLPQLIKLVDKKFGVKIDLVALLAKISATSKLLPKLEPLLIKPQKKWPEKVASYFREIGNRKLRMMIV